MHFILNLSISTGERRVRRLEARYGHFANLHPLGRLGQLSSRPAPGVYSDNIQTGGTRGYGTV